jgi:hypothetical protein
MLATLETRRKGRDVAEKKVKLLILDANEVIYLHEIGLWQEVVSRCDIFLARIVAEEEAKYYRRSGVDEVIDLSDDITNGRIRIFEQTASELKQFVGLFDPVYVASLDAGEAESLAYLVQSKDDYLISSADAIVFRVLGLLNRSDQGISLEEVLQRIGLGRAVTRQYTKQFRERYTREGEQDAVRGRGVKKR